MDELKFSKFTKKYGSFVAVDNLDLTVHKGNITGFVGKNGAGKSTTLRCIINILFPSSGEISVAGLDSVKNSTEIKSLASYLPSEVEFYPNLLVKDILSFAAKFPKGNFQKAMELSEILELNVDKKVSELSLGNKKKVSIVLALMKESEYIFLDEPSSGLDPLIQEKFFNLISQKKKEGITIFLSSHNLSEVERYCDRVVIIKDGRIVDDIEMGIAQNKRKQYVRYLTQEGKEVEYTYDGDLNELVERLSKLNLQQLEIRKASIEEEFIKYYK